MGCDDLSYPCTGWWQYECYSLGRTRSAKLSRECCEPCPIRRRTSMPTFNRRIRLGREVSPPLLEHNPIRARPAGVVAPNPRVNDSGEVDTQRSRVWRKRLDTLVVRNCAGRFHHLRLTRFVVQLEDSARFRGEQEPSCARRSASSCQVTSSMRRGRVSRGVAVHVKHDCRGRGGSVLGEPLAQGLQQHRAVGAGLGEDRLQDGVAPASRSGPGSWKRSPRRPD
jgi:hypothetical protein